MCQNRGCKRDVSIRDGSFFGTDSKLELKQVLDLLYLYAYEQAFTAPLMRECRTALEAIMNWRNYVRDISTEYFIRHPLRIGGPCHTVTVEIDESTFVRSKANLGRMVNTQWVSGGIAVRTKHGFLSGCATEGCCDAAANTAAVCFVRYHGLCGLVGRLQHDW